MTQMKLVYKILLYVALLVLLLSVFFLYGRPEFLMTVANQVWGCF